MELLKLITDNGHILSFLLAPITGFFGWVFGSKSRSIDLHVKAFQMNSNMIDAIKKDFEDRIKLLKDHIEDIVQINQGLEEIIKAKNLELEKYRNYEKNNRITS